MQQDRINLLRELLTIIRYSKDKEKFIKEFEAMHYVEAMLSMLEKIPENLRESLRLKIKGGDKEAILNFFSVEEYKNEVDRVADTELKKFIETISPVLTLNQKQKITKLLQNGDVH